jgi:ketosteroid isomerase-like protein
VSAGQVADELAIRNLVARMAQVADEASSLDEYAALLTPDSVWELEGQPAFEGRAAVVAGAADRRAQGLVGPGTDTRHVITTQSVIVEGDTASGQCTCLFYSDARSGPSLRAVSQYRDEFRRSPEGWQISRRIIRFG